MFWKTHPDAEEPLRAWHLIARRAQWRTSVDIRVDYGNASFVGNNRVVFTIKGNDYRLIVLAEYQQGRLFIRFGGTHAEYRCPEKFCPILALEDVVQNFSGKLYDRIDAAKI